MATLTVRSGDNLEGTHVLNGAADVKLSLPDLRSSFGSILRELRLERRISQRLLAEKAGISLEAISTLERGYRKTPRRATLLLIAQALELNELQASKLRDAACPASEQRRSRDNRGSRTGEVPTSLTRLIGRSGDVQRLRVLVAEHRLVTVLGVGGIGKTQIAIALARELADDYGDGVWFVDLSAVTDARGLLSAISTLFGMATSRARDPHAALAASLADLRALLILDNCEQVASDVASLTDAFAASCPHLRMIATSRCALATASETVYRLCSLSIPDDFLVAGSDAARFDAISLFVARARDVDSSFTLTDSNIRIIAEICRKLDGLPLSIELAARRTRALTLDDLLARLNNRLGVLTGGSPKNARQQSLRATLEWSYGLLNPSDRECFDMLGVFPTSFSLEAAKAVVMNDSVDEVAMLGRLEALVAKSLLVHADRGDGATRFSLLETIREFAAECLERGGRAHDARSRFLVYYHRLFTTAGAAFENDLSEANLSVTRMEGDNRIRALEIASQHGEVVRGSELLLSVKFPRELDDYVVEMTAAFAPKLPSIHAALASRLWTRHAYDTFDTNRDSSIAAITRALRLARASGNQAALASALHHVAFTCMLTDRIEDAHLALKEASSVPLSVAAKFTHDNIIALLATASGNGAMAARQFRDLAQIARRRGSFTYEFKSLLNCAEAEYADDNAAAAITAADDAVWLLPYIDRGDQAHFLANYTGYLVATGDFAEARTIGIRALRTAINERHSVFTLEHLALVEAREGNLDRAAVLAGYVRRSITAFSGAGNTTEERSRRQLQSLLGPLHASRRRQCELRGAAFSKSELFAFVEAAS